MLALYALSGGRHRLCVDCGQSRTAAFDPKLPLAKDSNRSEAVVHIGPLSPARLSAYAGVFAIQTNHGGVVRAELDAFSSWLIAPLHKNY